VAHPLILLAVLGVLLRWQVEPRYQLPSLIATTALILVFLSYCGVLLITPYALAWQVQSSFDRLILQLWPSFLLVFFVLLRRVVDPAPASVAKSPATRKSPLRSAKPVPAARTPLPKR
jgi:glucan phosphoethanolaminetransferase (alkaline phosphatase superfamily)